MKANLRATPLLLCAALCLVALFGCKRSAAPAEPGIARGAYDTEPDWNDHTKQIKLGYQESQGKRIFYQYCVWCHADAGPAGPSNRRNVAPMPPLMNDGKTLNREADEYMENIIALGGSAVGKSSMMPPYGKTLSAAEIRNVIKFTRAIAEPVYRQPGRPGLQTSITEQILARGSLVEGVGFPVSVNGVARRQSGPAPSGTISFFVGTTQLGDPIQVVADAGNGASPSFWTNSTMVTILRAGSYALTAQYSGDSNYAASTTSTTIDVLHRAIAGINVNPMRVDYGGVVTITGRVDTAVPSSNTAMKPTGTVTLSGTADGRFGSGVTTTTIAGASGNWAIQLSATVKPSEGEHFVLEYSGDGNYGPASVYSDSLIVNLPDFALTANPDSVTMTAGEDGSSTVTVTPLSSIGSTVVLTCSGPMLKNVKCTISPAFVRLANKVPGTATVTLSTLGPSNSGAAGALREQGGGMIGIPGPVVWRLGGGCVYAALLALLWWAPGRKRRRRVALGLATGSVVALAFGCEVGGGVGNGVPTAISIRASSNKVSAAREPTLTLTAKVTSSRTVTGTVNFWETGSDSALAPPATVVNGTATAEVALPFPGTHEIYAQYSGDANNRLSKSSAIDVVATGSAKVRIQGTTGPVSHDSSVYVTVR